MEVERDGHGDGFRVGQKTAFAIASTLSFLALLIAFLAMIATMTVNNMSHAGNTAVADRVNAAAKSPIISKKELAKFKSKVLDFSKQSRNISDARNKFVEVTLIWLLGFVLLGVLYLLKGWKFLRTAGWQLFSIGITFLAVHCAGPLIVHSALNNSTVAEFQKDLVPEVLKSLTRPMMILSIIVLLAGVVLLVANQLMQIRLRSKTSQMSPSVVA